METVLTVGGQQFILTGLGMTQDQFNEAADYLEAGMRADWSPIDARAQADFIRARGRHSGDVTDLIDHALNFVGAQNSGQLSLALPA